MNIFVNIPVPAANGSGAAVNMAMFGPSKTISVTGPFVAAVTIEISNEVAPTSWAPLITFNNPDGIVLDVACQWVRATVAAYKSGAPACDIGGSDDGAFFATIPATLGNGNGPAIDVSLIGPFKTVTVGGPFGGNAQIEVSEDGSTRWSQLGFGFLNPGQQTLVAAARYMRVVRSGVPLVAPGLPVVDVAGSFISAGPPGPPGSGTVNCLIYRPDSGLSGPVVFDDWNDLYAELQSQRSSSNGSGCYVISFDDTVSSPCVIPVGAYDMTQVTWEAAATIATGSNVAVEVGEGVTFSKLRAFRSSLVITFTGETQPVSDFIAFDVVSLLDGVTVRCSGTGPFFLNSVVGSPVVFSIGLGSAIADGGFGQAVINQVPGAFSLISCQEAYAQLGPDTLQGPIGSTFALNTAASGIDAASETQTNFFGTLTPQNNTRWRINPVPMPPDAPITTDTTLDFANTLALVDASGGPVVITLPIAAGAFPNRGQTCVVKSVGTGTITVVPAGADKIDGSFSGVSFASPKGGLTFISDGVDEWRQTATTGDPVVNEFDSSTNPNTADQNVEIIYLYSGAEVDLKPGLFNGQRVQVVLLESPAATCVVTTSSSIPTFKTNGDGLIPHYSLVLYWSVTLGEWVPTDTMQWDF